MQKTLSLFTALLTFVLTLPLAAIVGYSIGFFAGTEIHHKGDMGTGFQAIFLVLFALPLTAGICFAGVWLIKKIIKDIYGPSTVKTLTIWATSGLVLVALVTATYVALAHRFYNY